MLIVGNLINEKETLKKLRDLSEGVLRDKVYDALMIGADHVLAEAIVRVPFRTGALTNSLKMKGSKKTLSFSVFADYPNTGVVRKTTTSKQKAGSPEYYAVVVEYGSRKHVPAQPFLIPALEAKAKEILERIDRAKEEALNESGVFA
jgi:hypothetical protein